MHATGLRTFLGRKDAARPDSNSFGSVARQGPDGFPRSVLFSAVHTGQKGLRCEAVSTLSAGKAVTVLTYLHGVKEANLVLAEIQAEPAPATSCGSAQRKA